MRLSSHCTLALTCASAPLLLCAIPHQTRAAFIIDFVQDGSNVDATGSGSFNTAALTFEGDAAAPALVDGAAAEVLLGPALPNGGSFYFYETITGPSSFGSSTTTTATSGSGPVAGLDGDELDVPFGYVSGSLVTDSDTYDNTTLADLGLTNGTYTYTWGSGPTADSVVVNIGPTSAAPEPVSIGMLGVGGVMLLRRRRNQLPG